MIVLGKDKIDEQYNISNDGTITDLKGNIQEIILYKGRYKFKGIDIHRILMYTKYGYQKKDVHHIDENPLNNNINNLTYLTRSEHNSLHKKGKHLSTETKKKLSNSHKGNCLSSEWKKKISKSIKGKHWKINPETGKRIWY